MSAENFGVPGNWRLQKTRYRLMGEICPHCQTAIFPPRDVCMDCGKETTVNSRVEFSGKGNVYSFTRITDPDYFPAGFDDQGPYWIAMIKLDEGPLVVAQLTDLEEKWVEKTDTDGNLRRVKECQVEIGMPVEMVTRKLKVEGDQDRGLIIYGYKFRPSLRPGRQG